MSMADSRAQTTGAPAQNSCSSPTGGPDKASDQATGPVTSKITGSGYVRGHTLADCPVSGGGCGMIHDGEPAVYTHSGDADLDEHIEEVRWALISPNTAIGGQDALRVVEEHIERLHDQRSALAAALDRIDRGDGGDPTSIAAAALAEVGLIIDAIGGER